MQTAAELSRETPKRIAMSVTSAKPKRKALSVPERKLRVGPKKSHFAIRTVKLFNEVFSGSDSWHWQNDSEGARLNQIPVTELRAKDFGMNLNPR
jgi:hypothetical protein